MTRSSAAAFMAPCKSVMTRIKSFENASAGLPSVLTEFAGEVGREESDMRNGGQMRDAEASQSDVDNL